MVVILQLVDLVAVVQVAILVALVALTVVSHSQVQQPFPFMKEGQAEFKITETVVAEQPYIYLQDRMQLLVHQVVLSQVLDSRPEIHFQ
jgi:hypothetical protein